jgi:hypothetical protein
METTQKRAILRASELKGGPEALATYLNQPLIRVGYWMEGTLPIPEKVFLRIVDIIFYDANGGEPPQPDSPRIDSAVKAGS